MNDRIEHWFFDLEDSGKTACLDVRDWESAANAIIEKQLEIARLLMNMQEFEARAIQRFSKDWTAEEIESAVRKKYVSLPEVFHLIMPEKFE